MRRRNERPAYAAVNFKDCVLSIPGYTFERAFPWADTGSVTYLAQGSSLKDGSSILAKIVPAQSNGSMCLDREAHILDKLSGKDGRGTTIILQMIEYLKIPREQGDCVVLIMLHPGPNLLGRYLPPSKINDLLLSDGPKITAPTEDVHMKSLHENETAEVADRVDIMDLASFLEFSIQATRCLEVLHKSGFIHREVRANAFHLNSHSGLVRIVHYGNRSISLENYGSPSSLVIRTNEEHDKVKVKEALCYLAPEQTGGIETMTQDHRTDLYSIGILFWTLLVGRGQMPFDGSSMELLHSIVQKRPMPVHEVRRDIPQVLAEIVEKLLNKNPDGRYQSAYGLSHDLVECQRRLLATISSISDTSELIPYFEIGMQDRFMEFTMPISLFGRDKELERIRSVIRIVSANFSWGTSKDQQNGTKSEAGTSVAIDIVDDSMSAGSWSPSTGPIDFPMNVSDVLESPAWLPSSNSITSTGEKFRRKALRLSTRIPQTEAILVIGPPGIGKSSMILVNQAKWRAHGLWGQAKFQNADSAPFAALLGCLSSVLRQLMVFHTDLHRFVIALQERLGPQIQNIPLLYQGTPELKDVLAGVDIVSNAPREHLSTRELRARFQSLVETVFSVIADTRLFALFLDDLHEADESTLDLVSTLLNSRSRMLIFATTRSDKTSVVDRVLTMFSNRSEPNIIQLEALPYSAIASLVSKTLHRPRDDCTSLSRFVYSISSGNAFSARNVLATLHRQNLIKFDVQANNWGYDIATAEKSFAHKNISDPSDLSFLTSLMRVLPEEAQKYLTWAALFGETFKVTEVAIMIDWQDFSADNPDPGVDDLFHLQKAVSNLRDSDTTISRASMRGLQFALQEGWLIQRARDMCSFAHDRYRQAAQAEVSSLPEGTIEKMSFKIVLMMLHEAPSDVYRIADYAKRCLPLLMGHPKQDQFLDLLIDAGEAAWQTGAHERAIASFQSARTLLRGDPWKENRSRTFRLFHRLAALNTWQGDYDGSDALIRECYDQAEGPHEQAEVLQLRVRSHWLRSNFLDALNDTLLALKILGIAINPNPTRREVNAFFESIRNQIMAVGFDDILAIPGATDRRVELAVTLLNDAGVNAYWTQHSTPFLDILGLTIIQLALRFGMSSGTGLGFFWAVGAAERKELYRFAVDLGRLGLAVADKFGTSGDKCRAQVLYCAMLSGYDSVHISSNILRLEEAIKHGESSGDRFHRSLSCIYSLFTRLCVGDHFSDLLAASEECCRDVTQWAHGNDMAIFAASLNDCVQVLSGRKDELSNFGGGPIVPENVSSLTFGWYSCLKLISCYCTGREEIAAQLGFKVWESRLNHPNHRHFRYALFFHSLAMIACLRKGSLPDATKAQYLNQVQANQVFIRRWLSSSPINVSTWLALVDAEMAGLAESVEAHRLYDVAVSLASQNDWLFEEGWALYLQGAHFRRCGIEKLGQELQLRGTLRYSQLGAQGIVTCLQKSAGIRAEYPSQTSSLYVEAAVQTTPAPLGGLDSPSVEHTKLQEDQESNLAASDLAAILRWSKDISRDMQLSSALQRLTEITAEITHADVICTVVAREAGDYTLATSMFFGGPCQVHENSKPIRFLADPLQRTVIQYTLNSKEGTFLDDSLADARFSSEAKQTSHNSVICLPIFSNRGQTFGAVYAASSRPFTKSTHIKLELLCQQASISIANALLFRSVQNGTKENLKMIAAQKEALEEARRSREDALKATKIKSNFLASMSHELRTPFSSFYGLLDLLSGTDLNPGQSEIVHTAKQSCELLLKIITSILDYSKLEASALKLEPSVFLVESLIADCMELLLPMASKKLDLSFNIESNVPDWLYADHERIRQVLMNLIGNAVKFTSQGYVRVNCSRIYGANPKDNTPPHTENNEHVYIKFEIEDTGIGMSKGDLEHLFTPFHQGDNSSTRKFGGTGLGLSISRQLVSLFGGAIGVHSNLHRGSTFWFTICTAKFEGNDTSRKATTEIETYRSILLSPTPPRVLISSPSTSTLSLLNTMFKGFYLTQASSLEEIESLILEYTDHTPLNLIIVDNQSDQHVGRISQLLQALERPALKDAKVIQLFTPTAAVTGQHTFDSTTLGVIKILKPPRTMRILQKLAELKDPSNPALAARRCSAEDLKPDTSKTTSRTLFGNVLIAEDNPVAQQLLVKQLQRCGLNVTTANNGEEAVDEWERHEPGYFSVALFDHHMPICDGVEATKRLRALEDERNTAVSLPIVALSADCQVSTKQLCLSAGMNAFFSKPLRKPDLAALLSMFGPPSQAGES